MGLDIVLAKPCHKGESEYYTDCPNVVKKFPNFVTVENERYFDFSNLIPNYNKETYWETHSIAISPKDIEIYDENNNKLYQFKSKNVPTLVEPNKIVYYKEVGYQRKGANVRFYEDGIWESENYCAVTQKELDEHKEKYFTKNDTLSQGGWGSSVEYDLTDEEMKTRFEKNIYSKFKEGENFILYI